jgi:LuxR family maltose regulon positive regulatory protein
MSSPILVTKLFIPPTRSEIVSRPRLLERLNNGLNRKLTLISAPAGFGKTSLVTEWLTTVQVKQNGDNQGELQIAWLSLDEHDNDLVRFLSYFISALNRIKEIEGALGKEALQMLQSPQPLPPETILTSLINDVAVTDFKVVLVLDDYHLIEAQPIHEALNFLIENQPPQLHLAITTREDPPLLLSRLRARGQLSEIRAADLSFKSEEVAEFLNQVMGLGLAAEDVAVIEARTEGWIAGLQLAALSMQGRDDIRSFIRSFGGSNRLILDYLIDEVLEQQSAEIQNFLLKTSILDRLFGPLCDAVRLGSAETGGDTEEKFTGQQILEKLEHTNLFIIPLDEERCWYRYHHLFADLLRLRLRQTQPDLILDLHLRASLWYEQQGDRVAAIDHALHGSDYVRAIELIDANIEGNYESVALPILERWLTAIPDKLITTHPEMMLLKAWHQFNTGKIETADQNLMAVAELVENADQLANPMLAALSGRALAIRSFIASLRGDFAGSAQFAKQALDLLPATEQAWRGGVTITLGEAYAAEGQMADAQQVRTEALKLSQSSGNPHIIMIANLNLAETLWQQGEIMAVLEICERQVQFATEHDLAEAPIMGWLLGLWGASMAELNQVEKALELTHKGAEIAERGQDMFYLSYSYLYWVRVLFLAGDWPAVNALLQTMARIDSFAHWVTPQISAWQVRIWLAEGNLDAAANWLNENSPSINGEFPFVYEADYVAVARILLVQEQFDAAVELLTRLQEIAEAGGRYLRVIELLLLLALTAQARDDLPQALSFLEQALQLGESRGMIQTFVIEGPALARLLYAALQQGIEPAYVQRILAAFPVEAPQELKAGPSEETDWLEPLTDRESEILQLIGEGLTNKEISSRLYLSSRQLPGVGLWESSLMIKLQQS